MPENAPLWRQKEFASLLALAFFVEVSFAVVNLSSMPLYLTKDLRFGAFVATLVLTAFLFSEAVCKTFGGRLADRLGHAKVLQWALIVPALTCACTLLPPFRSSGAMVILRCFDGFAAALLWPTLYAHIGAMAPAERRSEAMSLLTTAYLGGIAVAFVAGGGIDDLMGQFLRHRTGVYSGGIWLGCLLFAVLFGLSLRIPKAEAVRSEDTALPDFRRLKLPFVFLLMAAVMYMAVGLPSTVLKLVAIDVYGLSSGSFGLIALPITLGLAAFSVASTKWVERLGRTRSVRGGLLLAAGGLAVISLGIYFPLFRNPWIAGAAIVPIGLGFVFALPAWMAVVVDFDPDRRATNLGVVMAAQGVGAMIGAPVGGWLFENGQAITRLYGGVLLPLAAAAVSLAAAYFLSYFAVKPRVYLNR